MRTVGRQRGQGLITGLGNQILTKHRMWKRESIQHPWLNNDTDRAASAKQESNIVQGGGKSAGNRKWQSKMVTEKENYQRNDRLFFFLKKTLQGSWDAGISSLLKSVLETSNLNHFRLVGIWLDVLVVTKTGSHRKSQKRTKFTHFEKKTKGHIPSQLAPTGRLELFTADSYGSQDICLFKGLHLFRLFLIRLL